MARRKSKSKTRKVKRGSKSMKNMKRSSKRMKRSSNRSGKSKSRSKAKAQKVSNILTSTYGLSGVFQEDEKGYKQQRVGNYDPYKKAKNKKGKKVKSSSKAAKDSFLAGIQSDTVSLPKQSKGSWLSHVKKVYEEGKRSQPGYKYKDAMKDAKNTW